ncbi:hypothetical protein [Histidinibacterium lentulum]|uniref:Uncharacterized protein n=1 Tax=Histidinibacterium lentulum TaxID=2480588 RepID=A0A3N2R7A7_9RHOB|nr:hypothetical protein [Histidinibacterium lentulum]ROU03359.1 hypothetical protein EAT49_03360 [Histidinibacterium lentulum]
MTPWLWLRASSVFQTSNLGEWLDDDAVASRAHARPPRQTAPEAARKGAGSGQAEGALARGGG